MEYMQHITIVDSAEHFEGYLIKQMNVYLGETVLNLKHAHTLRIARGHFGRLTLLGAIPTFTAESKKKSWYRSHCHSAMSYSSNIMLMLNIHNVKTLTAVSKYN